MNITSSHKSANAIQNNAQTNMARGKERKGWEGVIGTGVNLLILDI